MVHSVFNVKNLVGNVHANPMLLGDAVRPVVLDFLVSLIANLVTVPQLHSVKLTQVRFKQKHLKVEVIMENVVKFVLSLVQELHNKLQYFVCGWGLLVFITYFNFYFISFLFYYLF